MNAPIVLFAYNRVDHLRKTYDALKVCDGAKDSELFIFSDGPKNENAVNSVVCVRNEIKAFQRESYFKKIECIQSVQNKGLAASIVAGVTQIIKEYGKVIVLEDDCVASPAFLQYMNSALDYYENDKTIGSIAGYSEMLEFPEDFRNDIYLARRSCSSAWATWDDRWSGIDWNMNNIKDIVCNMKVIRRLNENGTDRLIRLYRKYEGKTESWSICFGAHHALNDWWVVYPRYSYIFNIGNDGSGIHTKEGEMDSQSDLSQAIINPCLGDIKMDERIQKLLKKKYSNGFISDMKRALATVGIFVKFTLK